MAVRSSKTAAKDQARQMLMHGVGNVLGYWLEDFGDCAKVKELGFTPEEFGLVLQNEADRVARLLGYDQAWVN